MEEKLTFETAKNLICASLESEEFNPKFIERIQQASNMQEIHECFKQTSFGGTDEYIYFLLYCLVENTIAI